MAQKSKLKVLMIAKYVSVIISLNFCAQETPPCCPRPEEGNFQI